MGISGSTSPAVTPPPNIGVINVQRAVTTRSEDPDPAEGRAASQIAWACSG